MYNPFKHIPSVDTLLVDSSTNTKKVSNSLSLSLLKKLCDPSKNYKYLEECMNSIPEVAKLKEEKFKLDHIKLDPYEEDNEAYTDAEMHQL